MMKKVVIFGAAGHTGKYLTRKMQSIADIELSVFVRNPSKFGDMDMTGVQVIQGDALNADDVRRAMDGQDILLCSLDGDVLNMAKNITAALTETSVKRIIWITGMGIHHEIKGIHGIMLNQLAKKMPEYIQAADTIAASAAVTTLLRCPGIRNGENEGYSLTREGEKPACWVVDRAAVAQCMADMIADDALAANESLGITNGRT
ncbi:MAG: NAD(P)H-binding protein [Clostridia bacterium]|nr:NAD(P)H-binding protein [Clostridia bacterium]